MSREEPAWFLAHAFTVYRRYPERLREVVMRLSTGAREELSRAATERRPVDPAYRQELLQAGLVVAGATHGRLPWMPVPEASMLEAFAPYHPSAQVPSEPFRQYAGSSSAEGSGRPAALTPAQLLGFAPRDPAQLAVENLLPQLRRELPLGDLVVGTVVGYQAQAAFMLTRGDQAYRMVAASAGVDALRACLEEGSDLVRRGGWAPREVLAWAARPGGIDLLRAEATRARSGDPVSSARPIAEARGQTGLQELLVSMGQTGSSDQRRLAMTYRDEMSDLSEQLDRLRQARPADVQHPGTATAEGHAWREAVADLYDRAETDHDAERLAGQDFRAIASRTALWILATDPREPGSRPL
jgi:hypothetical protein